MSQRQRESARERFEKKTERETEREGRETRAAKESESEIGKNIIYIREKKRKRSKSKKADQPTLELTLSNP